MHLEFSIVDLWRHSGMYILL